MTPVSQLYPPFGPPGRWQGYGKPGRQRGCLSAAGGAHGAGPALGLFDLRHRCIVDVENTRESRGYSFDTGGVTVGADYRLTDHFVLGTAFGYANTSADLNLGGRIHTDDGKGSVYGLTITRDSISMELSAPVIAPSIPAGNGRRLRSRRY